MCFFLIWSADKLFARELWVDPGPLAAQSQSFAYFSLARVCWSPPQSILRLSLLLENFGFAMDHCINENFQTLGESFVKFYYHVFDSNREQLKTLYVSSERYR